MGKFSDILKRNWIYAILLFMLVAVNVMAISYSLGIRSAGNTVSGLSDDSGIEESKVSSEQKKMFDPEEIKNREAKIQAIAHENPQLYFFLAAINLSILFVILLGIIIDVAVLVRRHRGEKLDIRLAVTEEPAWAVADVFRAVIIFVFAGYVFAFIQAFASGIFPVLRNPNLRMVSETASMNIAGIGVIWFFVFRKYSQGASAIGFARASGVKIVLTAVTGYLAIIPVFTGITVLTFFFIRAINYEPPLQPIVEVFMEEKGAGVLWMSTLFAAIFGPIAEEVFFRGFMYPAVKKKWGVIAGILGTSVIFSLLHAHIVGFLPILALGVLLAYLYEKTGSLLVPMAVHMMHNMGMVVMVFLMRAVGN
jgi:uncharacterized protein